MLNKSLSPIFRTLRKLSTKQREFREVQIPVPWGHVAGKWWEPYDKRPVLTVHGWQDSCGTFDRLIPLLTRDVGFLAVDLPGHGFSSRLPSGSYYHLMDNVMLIGRIARYFKWPKVSLMGHSMGGITCFTYTMALPETVDFILCIDGVKPLIWQKTVPNMAAGIKDLIKYNKQASQLEEPPSYTLDELKQKVVEPNNGSINIKYCHHILDRNISESKIHPGKYYFHRDPRLKSRMHVIFPQQDSVAGAGRVTNPIFITKSMDSHYYEDKANFYEVLEVIRKTSKDCRYNYVVGTHHTVLNNPEVFSELANDFINEHDTEDRTGGDLIDEVIV